MEVIGALDWVGWTVDWTNSIVVVSAATDEDVEDDGVVVVVVHPVVKDKTS